MKTKKVLNRKSIRLPEYDYSHPGAYFITICVQGKKNRLGEVTNGRLVPSQFGSIAHEAWVWLAQTFPAIRIPIFCVMPNHVHAIIAIGDTRRGVLQNAQGGLQAAPTSGEPAQHATSWA